MNEATQESTQLFMVWLTVSIFLLALVGAIIWRFGPRMATVFGALVGRFGSKPFESTALIAPAPAGPVDSSGTAPEPEAEPTVAPITAPIVEAEPIAPVAVTVTPIVVDPAAEAAAKAEKARKRREIVESMAVRQRVTGAYYYTVHEIRDLVGGDITAINKTVSAAREAYEAELAAA